MIEKLCPGLALCPVYNHLFLLCSSKIIFPIRAALFCFSTNMEARSLVSTSWVLCTADSVFYCMLNYDGHILVGTMLSLSLDIGNHVLIAHVRYCVRCELCPAELSGLVTSPHVCLPC